MTEAEILRISKYSNRLYHMNPESVICKGGDMEDLKQDLLLLAFMFPNEPISFTVKRLYNKKILCAEDLGYDIRFMKKFSELTDKTDNEEDYIERLAGGKEERYFADNGSLFIETVATFLYKKGDMKETFLDYMYGQSAGRRLCTIRQKLFNHRFILLEMLLAAEKISFEDFEKYFGIAQEMDKPIPLKKVLSDSYTARWQRAKYHANIEENREKVRQKAEKARKAEKAKNKKVSESKEDIK